MRGIQDSSNEKTINSHKVNNVIFSSLNQRYDIIICVVSQVSDVAHWPLVYILIFSYNFDLNSCINCGIVQSKWFVRLELISSLKSSLKKQCLTFDHFVSDSQSHLPVSHFC